MLGHFSADFAAAGLYYSVEEYVLLCSGADCQHLVFSVLIPAVLDGSTPTEKFLKLMKRYEFRVPTAIQKHNSMIFPWFSMINKCNFHDYLMHGLQPPLLAASSPH